MHDVRTKSHTSSSDSPNVTRRLAHRHDDSIGVYFVGNSRNMHSSGEHILLLLPYSAGLFLTDVNAHSSHLQTSSKWSEAVFRTRSKILTEVKMKGFGF